MTSLCPVKMLFLYCFTGDDYSLVSESEIDATQSVIGHDISKNIHDITTTSTHKLGAITPKNKKQTSPIKSPNEDYYDYCLAFM